MARPTSFTPEIADKVCDGIAEGKSLRAMLREDETLPASSTLFRWLSQDKVFSEQYARAREAQADVLFDEVLSIADEEVTMVKKSKHGASSDEEAEIEVVFDPTAVARNRLRVDARKWMAGKLRPKVYGDKVDLTHANPDGTNLNWTVEFVRPKNEPAAS